MTDAHWSQETLALSRPVPSAQTLASDEHLRGRNIEARLKAVENRVESLTTGVWPVWLTDTTRLCEVAEELSVKAEVVNWMFRVAQRFSGPEAGSNFVSRRGISRRS